MTKLQASMKEMEEEAGEAYVQRQEREAAVEANKGELEVARAEVCVGGGGKRGSAQHCCWSSPANNLNPHQHQNACRQPHRCRTSACVPTQLPTT